MFDEDFFSSYYDINNLNKELSKQNLTILDLKKYDKNELFYYALEKGLYDVVEHLYIDCNVSYNLTTVLSKAKPTIIKNSNVIDMTHVNETNGINNGLKLKYIDNNNIKINRIIDRLNYLRKYSKSKIEGKDYIYTFNIKYKDNI